MKTVVGGMSTMMKRGAFPGAQWIRCGLAICLAVALALVGGPVGVDAQEGAEAKEPITLDIMDDDALLLISKVDGRDIVRVVGRSRIRHKERTVETDELRYDEDNSYAVMQGNVELLDEGEDGLQLTADHLELDLNTESAFAQGGVRFVRKETRGTADTLRHGEFASLQEDIDAVLADRSAATRERVQTALATFLPDDEVLLLQGNVDLEDGDREFRSELVIVNTRDDALVSVGRSAATLPAPEDD